MPDLHLREKQKKLMEQTDNLPKPKTVIQIILNKNNNTEKEGEKRPMAKLPT